MLALLSSSRAQDQEEKLVDRLLRPKMELQNSAQTKKFTADRRPLSKEASVRSFYVQQKPTGKQFGGTRDFSAWEFNARRYRGTKQSSLSSRNQMINSHSHYASTRAVSARTSPDSNRTAPDRTYAGQRPFLGKGKSQKALSQQSRPMTIEEVRELLNKNK